MFAISNEANWQCNLRVYNFSVELLALLALVNKALIARYTYRVSTEICGKSPN